MLTISGVKLSGVTFFDKDISVIVIPPTTYLSFSMQGGSVPYHFIQVTSTPVCPINTVSS